MEVDVIEIYYVIIFQNGGQAFIGDNYPLRGTKSSIFEGGTRVPGMFHSPLATVQGIRAEGWVFMITSSNRNFFHVTGLLLGESTSHRWMPLIESSDPELWCFLWSASEQTVEQTIATPVI